MKAVHNEALAGEPTPHDLSHLGRYRTLEIPVDRRLLFPRGTAYVRNDGANPSINDPTIQKYWGHLGGVGIEASDGALMRLAIPKSIITHAGTAVVILALSIGPATAGSRVSLYNELGGSPGVTKLVSTFVEHLFSDPYISPFFDGVEPAAAREKLLAQFCDLAGGPCKTRNADMKKTHAGMDVTKGHFFAVLALLKQSMDELSIAPEIQQLLLDKLRPMQDDIVNTP